MSFVNQSDTGKTFEQYRENIQVLKLKIKEQQELNIDLKEQNYQLQKGLDPQIVQDIKKSVIYQQEKLSADQYKQKLMEKFYKSLIRLGVSLEMLYRCADVQNKNVILIEDFKIFLFRIKLSLITSEINDIIQIFNQDDVITKEHYYEILMEYGVNSEQVGQFKFGKGQKNLIRFSQVLKLNKISIDQVWEEMDSQQTNKIDFEDLKKMILVILIILEN